MRITTIGYFLFFVLITTHLQAQDVKWNVLAPAPNSSIDGHGLLIAVEVDTKYAFTEDMQVFIDKRPVTGALKLFGYRMNFLCKSAVRVGEHTITLKAHIHGIKQQVTTSWNFTASGKIGEVAVANSESKLPVALSGYVVADNRSENLSGAGQALRQEPDYTRTLSADVMARYKNAEIPVKLFLTTDNRTAYESRNYFQIGFRNHWVEVQAGDMNPIYDRLILTGVRVRGFGVKFKYNNMSLQFCYGRMSKAYEGYLQTYTPGSGTVPTNLVNDSQYVVPGIYTRNMLAGRLEIGGKRDIFRLGLTGFKAKDDINSIKYGLSPKDNIAGGVDITAKALHKSIIVQAGIAGSVLTKDISYGVANKNKLDSTFNIKIDFDPKQYENLIILNTSTVPPSLLNSDYLSYYAQVGYTNKYQSFTGEYRKMGPSYNSLGNPFALLNYQGFVLGDRFSLYKKMFNFDIKYRNYSNDLNATLPSKINCSAISANVFVNAGPKYPVVMLNFVTQSRDSKSNQESVASLYDVKDVINNYLINLSWMRRFWNLNHNFNITYNLTDRKDKLHEQYQFTSNNIMFGVRERIMEGKYGINASIGKTWITDASKEKITNINIYDFSFDWLITPGKYTASAALSNTRSLATTLSNESRRLSLVGRFSWKFYRGMGLDLEGGYQPFTDKTNSSNNYSEFYTYIRYSCDLGMLQL